MSESHRDEPPTELQDEVRRRRERREAWEREGHRSALSYLAAAGSVGWSVVLPALLGLAIGRWLDSRAGDGITWTAAGVFLGVALGSWTAWNQVVGR